MNVLVGVRCPLCARLHVELARIQADVRAAGRSALEPETFRRLGVTYAAWCERQQLHISEHARN